MENKDSKSKKGQDYKSSGDKAIDLSLIHI